MISPKTKRIVWTTTVALALAFVAAMVLHKNEKPQVIGNLSQKDVADISKIAVQRLRDDIKATMTFALKNRDVKSLARMAGWYSRLKVVSIETVDDKKAFVTVKVGTEQENAQRFVVKSNGVWTRPAVLPIFKRTAIGHGTNVVPVVPGSMAR